MSRSKKFKLAPQVAGKGGASINEERRYSASLIYKPPLPVDDVPILLKEVNPSVNRAIDAFAPFQIGSTLRLSVPAEIERKYPVIDRLIEKYGVSSPGQSTRSPSKSGNPASGSTSIASPVRSGILEGSHSTDEAVLSPSRIGSSHRAENLEIKESLMREAQHVMMILDAAQVITE
jgi:hypothetical protein